jgi:hypothetical protein
MVDGLHRLARAAMGGEGCRSPSEARTKITGHDDGERRTSVRRA